MSGMPFWLWPLEEMSPEAIELACDADRRGELPDTLIVRVK
jgi:hypothetical protein